MKYITISISTMLLLILIVGCSKGTDNTEEEAVTLTISAAASLNESLTEIKKEFEKEHSDIKLLINFGGSGALQQQIKQGAPVDLFFSADRKTFTELIEKDLIDKEKQGDIVENNLVLIIPNDSQLNSMSDLIEDEVQKVAIGTPESVPAGQYAKETMQSYDLWDSIQTKLVLAKDVRQVLTYVATGNVDAGFVYNTDALNSDKVKVVERIAEKHHSPILYPIGVVKSTNYSEEATLFYNYLKTDSAKKIFEKYGFAHRNDEDE